MQEVTPEYTYVYMAASDTFSDDGRVGHRKLQPTIFNPSPIRPLPIGAANLMRDYFGCPRVGEMDKGAKASVRRNKIRRKAQKLARRKNRK